MNKTCQVRLTGPYVPFWQDQDQNGGFSYCVMKDGWILLSDDGFATMYDTLSDMSSTSKMQDLFDLTQTNVDPTRISHRRVQQEPRYHPRSRI